MCSMSPFCNFVLENTLLTVPLGAHVTGWRSSPPQRQQSLPLQCSEWRRRATAGHRYGYHALKDQDIFFSFWGYNHSKIVMMT